MQFLLSQDIFWIEKSDKVQIVKDSDPRIFELEGIAAVVFLTIAQKKPLNITDEKLLQRVLDDLKALEFIRE